MTAIEVTSILGGGLIGYWIVSSFLTNRDKNHHQTSNNASSAQNSREQNRPGDPSGDEDPRRFDNDDVPSSWFRILGTTESATSNEIAIAYKLKISQYHPDKVATLGPELQELAESKSKQINAAYDYALRLRGQS